MPAFQLAVPACVAALCALWALAVDVKQQWLPRVGLGVAGHLDNDISGTSEAVKRWLHLGGRFIDTALMYNNHEGVRKGVAASLVPPEEVFIMTKVPPERMGYEETLEAVEESLQTLGVKVLSCVLIHWPGRTWAHRHSDPPCVVSRADAPGDWTGCRQATWEALVEAKRRGWVRHIGVANYELPHLEEMSSPPEVIQMEFHPWWRRDDILKYAKQYGVEVVAYGSLGGKDAQLLGEPRLQQFAARSSLSSVAQLLLSWASVQGIAVIPSARSKKHQKENLYCCSISLLPKEAMSFLSTIPPEEQHRTLEPDPRFIYSPRSTTANLAGPAPMENRRVDPVFGSVDSLRAAPVVEGGCWMQGFGPDPCCMLNYGLEGHQGCWDGGFTLIRCCSPTGMQPLFWFSPSLEQFQPSSKVDFIVVGAGSGGSIAAARLAESGASVLLLDSGDWDNTGVYTDHPNPSDPSQASRWFSNTIEWPLGAVVRSVQVITGRALGGTSSVNGHIYTRTPLPMFESAHVDAAYRKVEKSLTFNHSNAGAGPLSTNELKVLSAFGRRGFRFQSHGRDYEVDSLGSVLRVTGCHGDEGPSSAYRCSIASAPSGEEDLIALGRVKVIPRAHVQRVLVEGGRAVGVELVHGPSGSNPPRFFSRKGVFVAAGALQTPLLLVRSGIGPAHDLQRLGIPPVSELNEVGFGLHDHPYLPLMLETGLPCNQDKAESLQNIFAFVETLSQAKASSNDAAVELQLTPRCKAIGGNAPTLTYKVYIILLHSKSLGRVVAKSANAADLPVLRLDMFSGSAPDPYQLIRHARDFYRLILEELAGDPAFANLRFDPPKEIMEDDVRAAQFAAQHLSLWQHPASTAQVGKVVDQKLNVFGVQGLKVADASVLPDATGGHPDAAIRAIGYLAAESAFDDQG